MESALIEVCNEVLLQPKVTGYLCSDDKGLCIYSRGISPSLSGVISSIASTAKSLEPGSNPVVELETDKGKLLIQGRESIVTAIYKTK